MLTIKSDFEEKKIEADILLSHVGDLSEAYNSVEKTAIVKSALVLLLYNMLESTMFAVLEEVHEKLSRCSYKELAIKNQKLYIDFYFSDGKVNNKLDFLNKTISEDLRFPSFRDFSNKIRLFSGNLDVRRVNAILKLYGISSVVVKDSSAVLTVKNKRNKLAHGEEMMKNSCRGLAYSDIVSLKKAVEDFLGKVIDSTDVYLLSNMYRV